VTAIPLGRPSRERLGATYPHTPRAGSTCAYLVLLRAEIARFTPVGFAARGRYSVPGWTPGPPGLRRAATACAAAS